MIITKKNISKKSPKTHRFVSIQWVHDTVMNQKNRIEKERKGNFPCNRRYNNWEIDLLLNEFTQLLITLEKHH